MGKVAFRLSQYALASVAVMSVKDITKPCLPHSLLKVGPAAQYSKEQENKGAMSLEIKLPENSSLPIE